MERNRWRSSASMAAAAMLLIFLNLSLSTSSSGDILDSQVSVGRKLLQAKQSCPLNFEFANYTIIISQCKGPLYPASVCCAAFKEFACPYVDEIDNEKNDCAATMFSYINLYGKYPPGLFAMECKEGKQGLACPATSAPSSSRFINCTLDGTVQLPKPQGLAL
ncbi:hypothetical protein Nepgr_007725 [Nepenthes gracilis]|uniref:GPI-anchored protein LLG1-like domain-containing protein n=1 Tax=Nepenthes gracilis TaxID=150966 RepID=A0AAD3S7I6_NEPGR|nr:hypothetical protein Nepgr_007725 [Nepenthes gracilis]